MPDVRLDEVPDRGPDGMPDKGGGTGCPTGQTGPDKVPDESHVIFECHVTRLG